MVGDRVMGGRKKCGLIMKNIYKNKKYRFLQTCNNIDLISTDCTEKERVYSKDSTSTQDNGFMNDLPGLKCSSNCAYKYFMKQRRETISACESFRTEPLMLICSPLTHLVPVETEMT